jgi:hypothetical protein
LALSRLAGDLQYLAVNEVQKRGALHKHILVRSAVALDPVEVQRLALAAGFGCSIDLAPMSDARAARYVAKYASKGYTDRAEVPWRGLVLDEDTGELELMLTMAKYRTVSQSRHWGLTLRQIKGAISESRARARDSIARAAALDPLVAGVGAGLAAVAPAGVSARVAHSPP